MVSKLNNQLLNGGGTSHEGGAGYIKTPKSKNSLTSLFDHIADVVTDSLEDIIRNQKNTFGGKDGEDELGMALAKDFLKDLENEEFFSKNFRVRPVSGVTNGLGANDYENKSEHVSRSNLAIAGGLNMNGEATDDEDKFNRMMNMEMKE